MFKRNKKRILNLPKSGTKSVPVTRYYQSKNTDIKARSTNNDTEQKSKIKVSIVKFIKSLPQKIIILSILAIILLNTTIANTKVRFNTTDKNENLLYRTAEEYDEGVQKALDESLLNISKFTFSSSKFESKLAEIFPEVSTVNAVVPLAGRNLQVGLNFSPALVKIQLNDNKQGIVGENGELLIAVDSNLVPANYSNLPQLSVDPLIEFTEGSKIFTTEEAEILYLLKNEFDGSSPVRPKLKSINYSFIKREINARFDGASYFAKLTPERDARQQVGALVATVNDLSRQGKLPQNYIDVRVKDRVYVK